MMAAYMWHAVSTAAILVICVIEITWQSHVNLALRKPTLISSGLSTSARAVDGNRDPSLHTGRSCTHTNRENNPWWSVDLQHRYTVGSVNITNRDQFAYRLTKIRIGTTDTDPAVTTPSAGNIKICASRDRAVAAGVTQPFYCTATGRYLVVLLLGSRILHACEVEVFELRNRMHFLQKANSRLVGHVMNSLGVRNKLVCAHECTRHAQCGSFNLHVSGSVVQCELNAETSPQQTANDMTADTQWTFHQGTVILD